MKQIDDDSARMEVLNRLNRGEISPEAALSELKEINNPKKSSQKRIQNKARKKRGRPNKDEDNFLRESFVTAYWYKYRDSIVRMVLREILAEALCIEKTKIGRIIAKLNKQDESGFFTSVQGNRVIRLSPHGFRKMLRREPQIMLDTTIEVRNDIMQKIGEAKHEK